MQSRTRITNRLGLINDYLAETGRLLDKLDRASIDQAVTILLDCYQNQGRVFTMGNGGSASAAQHFASDLSKYVIPHQGVPFDARCLTDNVALYTAWANDAPRQDVFVNQVRGLLKPGDAVIAVSVHGGSGFSADLVNGVRYANRTGARTISIVGFDGGLLKKESTCVILVPVESTPQTEGMQAVIQHVILHLIREELAERRSSAPAP